MPICCENASQSLVLHWGSDGTLELGNMINATLLFNLYVILSNMATLPGFLKNISKTSGCESYLLCLAVFWFDIIFVYKIPEKVRKPQPWFSYFPFDTISDCPNDICDCHHLLFCKTIYLIWLQMRLRCLIFWQWVFLCLAETLG